MTLFRSNGKYWEGNSLSNIVSMFEAHQYGDWPRPHPAARKILSLHQNDLLAIERDGGARQLMRVVTFGQNGQITLAEPQQASALTRRDAAPHAETPINYFPPTCNRLKKARARTDRTTQLGPTPHPRFPTP